MKKIFLFIFSPLLLLTNFNAVPMELTIQERMPKDIINRLAVECIKLSNLPTANALICSCKKYYTFFKDPQSTQTSCLENFLQYNTKSIINLSVRDYIHTGIQCSKRNNQDLLKNLQIIDKRLDIYDTIEKISKLLKYKDIHDLATYIKIFTAKPNTPRPLSEILIQSILHNNINAIRILLKNNVDPNYTTLTGQTPLDFAYAYQQFCTNNPFETTIIDLLKLYMN